MKKRYLTIAVAIIVGIIIWKKFGTQISGKLSGIL